MPREQPLALVGSVIFFMRCRSGAKRSTDERMPAGSSPLRRPASKSEWSRRWCRRRGPNRLTNPARRKGDEFLDVGDVRDVAERDLGVGEQRGAEDGQDGVLVARRRDGAAQGLAAVDDEIGHALICHRERRRAWRSSWIASSLRPRNDRHERKKAPAGADAFESIRARGAGQGLSGSDAALAAALGAIAATAAAATTAAATAATAAFAAALIAALATTTLAAAIAAATVTTLAAAFTAMLAVGARGRGGLSRGGTTEEGLQPAEEAAGLGRDFRGGLHGARGRAVDRGGRTLGTFRALATLARGAAHVARGRHVGVARAHIEELRGDRGDVDRLVGRTLGALFAARTLRAGLAGGLEALALPSLGGRGLSAGPARGCSAQPARRFGRGRRERRPPLARSIRGPGRG
jgi:hypothetical protein